MRSLTAFEMTDILENCKTSYKPDFVSRLSRKAQADDSHSSRINITVNLKQPTRVAMREHLL